jgi:N-acetylglucosaminyldiphosphoundecaprenol N-acetyl-beta-D-mannosaminyltransferase
MKYEPLLSPHPSQAAAWPRRVYLLGTPVDLLSLDDTVMLAELAMASHRPLRHVALNVAKLIKLRSDPELRRDVVESDIIGVDGMGIVFALRMFGRGCGGVQRASGVDLMDALLAHCAATGRRPFILGAEHDVLHRAAAIAVARYPGLEFAGLQDGYFGPDEEAGIVDAIWASNADCLFVAMPTPKKERFLHRHGNALAIPFTMGVGGAVDVLAGVVSRAPGWSQRWGLEWLHRLIQEPRKMARRYIGTNLRFALILLAVVIRAGRPVTSTPPPPPQDDEAA